MRTKAGVSQVLEPEMSLLSGLRMHSVIDSLLSTCFIDVGLVLQSDRKFWKCSQAPKCFVVGST